MKQPNALTYVTPYKTIVINDPREIITINGIECLDGGSIMYNGQLTTLQVRIDNKPDLAKMVTDWRAEWDVYNAYKVTELATNVPGLAELRKAQDAAYNDEHRYNDQMQRMMEDEDNDGVNPPVAINKSLREQANDLAKQYPRAAVYLRAESYATYSDNVDKYTAGKTAMDIIATGGSLDEAINTLDNWLPKNKFFD